MISFFDNYDMDKIQNMQISMFKKMIKENEYSCLEGNVLILSDRLSKLATELYSYMKDNTNANMIGVTDTVNNIEIYLSTTIDYFIVVGYLERTENYDIIDILRSKNPNIKTVQWALLDDHIMAITARYNISFQFDRFSPPRKFMHYLNKIKELHD